LIIIDKNSLLGEASIRKRGVGGKDIILQKIGNFKRFEGDLGVKSSGAVAQIMFANTLSWG